MKNKLKNIPIQLAITIAILVFLIVFINIATATMGRYTTSFGGEFNFVANSKRTINVSCGEWEEKAGFNLLPIEMTCTNGATDTAQSISARIRLYIPERNYKILWNRKRTALPAASALCLRRRARQSASVTFGPSPQRRRPTAARPLF